MTGRVVVVGLGPGGPDLVTDGALTAISRVPVRFVRTTRHPAATVVAPATSFDGVYDAAPTLADVYERIVDSLADAAAEHGEVLYAVPGSPCVAERTVELLRLDPRVAVDVLPALSFLDLAWARLGIDPIACGPRVVDAHRFAEEAAGERGPLLVAQCDSASVLSAVKLAFEEDAPSEVTVLQRLGLPDERIFPVEWSELDRAFVPDHLTSLWLPSGAPEVGRELIRFAEVVRELRERCPWDREQTHESLARYAVEEAYEVVDAIAGGEPAHLEEELGDLLLQVFLHAAVAAQAGSFTLADVARGITEKMVRRHPHVFADVDAASAEDVRRNWEQIKSDERSGRPSSGALDGVPGSLPALLYAAELGKKAASVGFDWRELDPVFAKVDEELAELRSDPSADELGDLLFAVVNVARHLRHDPEVALRQAASRFRSRFELVEQAAAAGGIDLGTAGPEVADQLWEDAKAELSTRRGPSVDGHG